MSWREGYVTEIDYIKPLCREQNPAWLSMAALWAGVQAPRIDAEFTLLELGCGHGTGALLAAALFPQARFFANDFMPAHVESATRLRDDARLDNLTILPDSFAELAQRDDLPACDFIVAHGVFSWVSAENQACIMEIVRRLLKPGGLFYVSYNSAVGWAGMSSLRQLLMELVEQDQGPLQERMQRALDMAARFASSGPGIPALDRLGYQLQALRAHDPVYLVHEYLNRHWQPIYPSDMQRRMSGAGLEFVGSAHLFNNVAGMAVPPMLQPFMAEHAAEPVRELFVDMVADRAFRCDIYGRDVRPLSNAAERRHAVRFLASNNRQPDNPVIDMHGLGFLPEPTCRAAILDRLAQSAASYAELAALPGMPGPEQTLATLTAMLQGGQIFAVPAEMPASLQSTQSLNRALLERARRGVASGFLVAPAIAAASTAGLLDMLFVGATIDKAPDLAERVWQDIAALGTPVPWHDGPIAADSDGLARLRTLSARFTRDLLPWLGRYGIIPDTGSGIREG
ncbi:class I SAM-dependent methyltransferase [Asticcacaulis sp.]|uniref:class I SAM-dependent methyltransferase n=1 Tax=Asticcacaulis sp. TaxID=1872648 RepID=UPI00262DF6C5|nr:class I SAM-dependent methyltransferase [Asticcacaulis sp.]